ncbi:hypothetical protein [Pseudoalteromonas luteoviolacea]|uniref:Uncharacterized protein n=1 Tax=Pseudoalteromonas luteoviolacea H33 TaxID=1365251 RepID=A0A167EEL7_9GAMM|nr:hypothetical protein [Pseudoalteromonas luteoviolacea]KZN50652.1 hypothetical protein N476_15295 [Pseudoalteromonas luteoviolacea H33]KZN77596.1 hypothetical protein N477_11540 [Pseudoalteromonas luteoviolacea H33-S]MBQ4877556.1 hypothetical protein [Pseudoalteromonas luteoviolacea]MBQ4906591.1 hypothetical protein [Pseudoalteromonas luteoviolacea]
MKIHKMIIALISITSFNGFAQSQLSWQQINSWIAKPKAIEPWEYQQQGKLRSPVHTLTATSPINGGGALIYRVAASPCFVSIPHQFHDKYTLKIGRALFESNCNMMVFNTHHRHSQSLDNLPMDYSKRKRGLHVAAVKAFHYAHPNAAIFQIHGFNQKKRKSPEGKKADFILSQGRSYNAKLAKLQRCLSGLSNHTYIYQKDIFELGGTKNILHKIGLAPHRFIHIEISKPMRKRLITQSTSMEQFNLCLSYSR